MVRIVSMEKRLNKVKNQEFNVMVLQGDVEIVFSKATGKPYIAACKTSIPCTLDEQSAKMLIGQTLPGAIERKECEPYEFLVSGTKKPLTLHHTFQYSPDPATVEEVVG